MSCAVYSSPNPAFAKTNESCSHIRIGVDVEPQRRIEDPRGNVRPMNHPYLHFSQMRATESLNLLTEDRNNVGVFPRNIYAKEPFASSVSYNIQPRDRTTHYTYSPNPSDGKEKSEHTPWQSVFGYDRFQNEYGVGVQSRGYIEPPECHMCNDVPHGVAPPRFYSEKHLFTNTSEFRDAAELYATPVCIGSD